MYITWFLNFPALRYAGYAISLFLIAVPISYSLSRYKLIDEKKFVLKIKILFIICLVIFNVRNLDRIQKKFILEKNDNYNFITFPFYWTQNVTYSTKKVNNVEISILDNNDMCWAVKPVCIRRQNINIDSINGFIFYFVDDR